MILFALSAFRIQVEGAATILVHEIAEIAEIAGANSTSGIGNDSLMSYLAAAHKRSCVSKKVRLTVAVTPLR